MTQLFENNAASTLAGNLTAGASSMTVQTGHGDRFPIVASPDTAKVTLENAAGDIEVVKITARAAGSDSMTIAKGQEGTTDRSWLAGDIVSMRITAGDIQKAVNDTDVHIADTAAAHAASAISNTPAGNISSTTVQDAINELDGEKASSASLSAHTGASSGAHAASAISNTPAGNIAATTVQAAINELDTEKAKVGDVTASGLTMNTGKLLGRTTASAGAVEEIALGAGLSMSGGVLSSAVASKIAQVVSTTIAAATGTTSIPDDNTAPLSSEGTQIASLSITPSSASNKVRVRGNFDAWVRNGDASANGLGLIVAVFRGSVLVGAKRFIDENSSSANAVLQCGGAFEFEDAPATTSAQTYSLRVGYVGNTTGTSEGFWINRTIGSATALASSMAKSIFTAEEISV